jgi:hypothetical protein
MSISNIEQLGVRWDHVVICELVQAGFVSSCDDQQMISTA